jgi:hypothetical protein
MSDWRSYALRLADRLRASGDLRVVVAGGFGGRGR